MAIVLLLMGLWSNPVEAQVWFNTYDQFIEGHSIIRLADGGYIISGRSGVPAGAAIDNASLLRVDVDGEVVWAEEYGGLQRELAIKLIQAGDGGIVATGSTNSFGGSADVLLFKTSIDGSQQWMQAFGSPVDSDRANTLIQTADGGYLMTGCLDCTGSPIAFLIKTDAFGNGVWTRTYPIGQEGFSILQTADGGFVVAGVTDNDAKDFIEGSFLLKTDADGFEEWSHTYKGDYLYNVYDLLQTTDGFFLTGGSKTAPDLEPDLYLLKTNLTGDSLWTRTYGGSPASEVATDILSSIDGSLYLSGTTFESGNGDLFLLNTDLDGNLNWSRSYGDPQLEENGKGIVQNPDGTVAVAGVSRQYDGSGNNVTTTKVLLTKVAQNGAIMDSYINGQIYLEENANCLFDPGEPIFPRLIIEAAGNQTYYGTTDANGHYSIPVNAGSYDIRVYPSDYWQPCTNPVTGVVAQGTFDTTIVNIGLTEQITCPLLEIDISTPLLRQGNISTYTINFCNNGPALAATSIELFFDDDLLVTGTSLPFTALGGNRYLFDGGALGSTACNSFTVDALLNPGATVEGETHCVEARILPDSICLPVNPNWEGYRIEVEGECVGDSVRLRIRNNSGVDMTQARQFIVIEDMIIERTSNFQLNGQDEMEIMVYPEGKTIRFEAQQAPGHPGYSRPALDIEGCGLDAMSDFSRSIATVFPEDDGDAFISIDCQESQNTFPTHENKAYPKGKPTEHFILPNTELEYHIRVQNTFPQTIGRMVIRDTLSSFVNPASLKAGAASHPYTFEVYDDGVVKFVFDNINLPSYLVNERASHAFIKFKVQQQVNLLPGTVITNHSAVFFDNHTPQPIDLFFHTIERQVVYASQQQSVCSGEFFNGIPVFADTVLQETIVLDSYDSVAIYEVEVLEVFEEQEDAEICNGDSYLFGNNSYIRTGVYQDSFTAINGCDSLEILLLDVLQTYNYLLDTFICEGQEVIFNNTSYTEAGEYTYTFQTQDGCDSLETLVLEVGQNASFAIDTILEAGQPYHENIYTQDTILTEIYTAANGCDSVLTVNIFINKTSVHTPLEYDYTPLLTPNPGSGHFILNFSLNRSSEFSYELYDIYGKRVGESKASSILAAGDHQLILSISDLPTGTYMLYLRTQSGTVSKKILKI